MQESIEIAASYPDLGECSLHFREVVHICQDVKCNLDKYCCRTCLELHRGHKSIEVEEYARNLAKRFAAVFPSEREEKQALIKSFVNLQQITADFQAELEQTYRIFKQIKMKEYEVISRVLKSTQAEIYDYLCELDLRKNGRPIENILKKMNEMNLGNAAAPKYYDQWVHNIQSEVKKFLITVQKLREQVLDVSSLDFKSVLQQIKNEQEKKKQVQRVKEREKEKEKERQKQKDKNSPIKQEAPKQLEPVYVNLKQKDFVPQQIIQRILCHYPQSIVSIDIDTNSMSSVALAELFNTGLQFTRLEKLIMSNNYLDQQCLEVLINGKIPNLKILNLENNFIQQDQNFPKLIERINAKWPGINLII